MVDPHGYAGMLDRPIRIEKSGAYNPYGFISQTTANDVVPPLSEELDIVIGEQKYVMVLPGSSQVVETSPVEGFIDLHDVDIAAPDAFGKKIQGVSFGAAVVDYQHIDSLWL